MQEITANTSPAKLHGVPFYEETHLLERVPAPLREQVPSLQFLGRRIPGARLCFRTDAEEFTVRMELETLSFDVGISLYSCQSCNVLLGDRQRPTYLGLVNPPDYDTKVAEKTFAKPAGMEDVTIFFPRNEIIKDVRVILPDDANVEAPTPYRYGPVVFYGSSITEGGSCSMRINTYTATLSNRLNFDYYNMGFSGAARGELCIADYLCTLPMTCFVYDYDHNAPTVEHLAAKHEPFFRRIREKHPDLPIVMVSRPDFTCSEENEQRRQVILRTYENAKAAGDDKVWFVNGKDMFPDEYRFHCANDLVHPNDLGFHYMANAIEPVLKEALGIEQ